MANKLIALDDGHGKGTAGKRTPFIPELGRQIRENEFNREVVKFLDAHLKRNGFRTLLTAPTDADTPLATRVNTANNAKADLLISVHFNAMDGIFHGNSKDASGFSAHVHSKQYESGKFGAIALKHLANGTAQKNRGLVQQNLYMTRESRMPAVLLELGFMDYKREAMLMIDVDFQKECAQEIAMAVCEYYGVQYKGQVTQVVKPVAERELYRVRKSWKDADSQVAAYHNLDAAKAIADRKDGFGVFNEAGKEVYRPKEEKEKVHVVKAGEYLSAIANKYKVSVDDIARWNGLQNPNVLHIGQKLKVEGTAAKPAPVKKPAPKPAPKPTPQKYILPTVTVKYGSRGVQVTRLQLCLNAANFKLKGQADGIFGPDTLQALKRFQSVYTPHEVDGVAGPNTRAALNRVLNK